MSDNKTGPQFFDLLRSHFARSIPHIAEIGMRVVALSEQGARVELPYRPDWLGDTQRGLIHTGIITTIVDSASGLAVFAAQREYLPIATLDLRMDYLRAAVPDKTLYCHAECYRLTRSIAFVRAHAWQDDESEPVAVSQSTFMRGSSTLRRKST
ncbi:MAG: PaaI family thioesterase [Pseudomonadota bacterium]